MKEAFNGDHIKDSDKGVLYQIIAVKIDEGNKITIQTSANGVFEPVEKHFTGNGSQIIMDIIKNKEGSDTVKPGTYDVKIE